MPEVFPRLADTRITHTWGGLVAYAFDHVPHLGEHDGLYDAMEHCGSGVACAGFIVTSLDSRMLGETEQGMTAFDELGFSSRPIYTGSPFSFRPSSAGTGYWINWDYQASFVSLRRLTLSKSSERIALTEALKL
jgi:hypothetical protein